MKIKGFTLLEMIITLAIMGVAMISIVKYKEKEANESRRQIISNTLLSEIDGVLKFVSEEKVKVIISKQEQEITNPLYGDLKLNPYTNRANNRRLDDAMSTDASNSIDWGAGNSTRIHFTRKSCVNTGTQGRYEFVEDYIPCKEPSLLSNSELKIDRIDLIGVDANIGSAIDRVDIVLDFEKTSVSDTFAFTNYIKNLESAADKNSISLKDIYVLEKKTNSITSWSLVKVGGKTITLENLVSNLAVLDKNKRYGLRLSIDPNVGKFLRADGRVGADSLCWNIASKMSGPCITADNTGNNLVLTQSDGSKDNEPGLCWDLKTGTSKLCLSQIVGKDEDNNDSSLLKLKDETGNPATLLANVLVEDTSLNDPNKKVLRTIPNTTYAAFGNSEERHLVIQNPESYVGNVTTEEGRIELSVQECPVVPDGNILHPRLTASVASVVADTKDAAGQYKADFSQLSAVRRSGGLLGQLSGAAIQVNKSGNKWYITSTLGVFNPNDNTSIVYLNPRFLSINITTWCSTEEQT